MRVYLYCVGLVVVMLLQLACEDVYARKFHKQYFDWTLFSNEQGGKFICYIVAIPVKKSGVVQNRGEPYFIITKVKNALPEISAVSGYYFKENSELELSFGLRKFNLLAFGSQSWTYGIGDDIEIIKAMRDSDSFVVTAKSKRNEVSEDVYSIIGFAKAYEELQKICN
jgi:hypothetical protein